MEAGQRRTSRGTSGVVQQQHTEAGAGNGDTVDRHSKVSSDSPEPTPLRDGVKRLQPPCGKRLGDLCLKNQCLLTETA